MSNRDPARQSPPRQQPQTQGQRQQQRGRAQATTQQQQSQQGGQARPDQHQLQPLTQEQLSSLHDVLDHLRRNDKLHPDENSAILFPSHRHPAALQSILTDFQDNVRSVIDDCRRSINTPVISPSYARKRKLLAQAEEVLACYDPERIRLNYEVKK